MPVPLEKFVQQLEDSGILAGDTIKDFIPPKASPKDAEELARELVRKRKLTKFQAEEVSKGKGKSLLLGNYLLMEKIGAGGMGQVFKARHRVMERLVAVKVLPTAMTKDQAAIARFHREVKAAAKLNHPNIVTAHDADQANGVHFLVMELVEGSDLSALVKMNGPLSVEKAVNYVLQAAKGLEAAHVEGIVHRDMKPANLLLDKKGVVKILDMGLARLSLDGDDAPQAALTSTGTIMGTVDYMAPEQALDTKAADARADVYALGCSLYFLLTGKSTYEGDTLMKKLLAHRENPIPALRTIRPEVTEQLEVVFKKLVAKKVEDRFQSMTEVIVELERCSTGSTTSMTIQQPATTTFEESAFDFHKRLPDEPTILAKPTAKAAAEKMSNNKTIPLIGAAVLGVAILAGIIVSLRTKDGTLVVEIDQPDAMVQVLDAAGKVEISQKGGKGLVSISVDPGKHRLQVEKDGFTVFGQDFEMKSGGKTSINAKLVPLDEKPALVGTKPALVVNEAKMPLFFQTPEFEPWAKEVASMPAEQQVEAVSKKLMELNPGFDGKLAGTSMKGQPLIQNGFVTVVGLHVHDIADISPVRALTGLETLGLIGKEFGKGKLSDLSPLGGMQIQTLFCTENPVSNLSPLQELPRLTQLFCYGTPVADLSPLGILKLTRLDCSSTLVNDLSSLKGMPLTELFCKATAVSDLSPLEGMNLTEIQFTPRNINKSIDAIRKMKSLKTIGTQYMEKFSPDEFWKKYDAGDFGKPESSAKPLTDINSPAFQQWMKTVQAMPAERQIEAVSKKLVELNPDFDGKVTPVIENDVVTNLNIVTHHVTDISPVRALTGLEMLFCEGTEQPKGMLADISPLKGMRKFHNLRTAEQTGMAFAP